mgnify:CR=1 FL=1|tara:strand:- start:5527 stop:6135 length:609 start_codon:yes stop_codon:yes gene_type:complete
MSVRKERAEGLSVKQRLTLFHNTSLTAEQALSLPEGEITIDALLKNGVKAINIAASGIRFVQLKEMGANDASQLRRLGFDALHLVDPVLCGEASAAFGAKAIIETFLVTPQDAVALSGSEAVQLLNLSMNQLLEACAGSPTEAAAVLQQSTSKNVLEGVDANVLLDTGLRAPQLKQVGLNLVSVSHLVNATRATTIKLGFSL